MLAASHTSIFIPPSRTRARTTHHVRKPRPHLLPRGFGALEVRGFCTAHFKRATKQDAKCKVRKGKCGAMCGAMCDGISEVHVRLEADICVRYKAHPSLNKSYATRISGWTAPGGARIVQEDAGNVPEMSKEVVGPRVHGVLPDLVTPLAVG